MINDTQGTNELQAVHQLVWMAFIASLIAVSGWISIPLGPISPVPITLQTMVVTLAGLILGPRYGAASVLLYLLAGLIGLPVFAGGKSGLAAFLGPTGGYLIGFVICAIMCGIASGSPLKPAKILFSVCLVGNLVVLLFGSAMLMVILNISLTKAFLVGFAPFLPGAIIKSIAAAFAYRFMVSQRLLRI